MAEQIYRYKAFISYRHVDPDRRWAKWLIDSLETFRTPKSLLAQGVPSHIGHLFRDDEEIPASSNLSNQIEEALKAAQYLIVVCSPNTPKSQWCRHEIDYFRKLGKGDRILALLIEGEPSESFPPELLHVPYEVTHADGSKTIEMRDEEPIASDIRPRADEPKSVTERRALIRIAATLLGVSFDDLAQRDHQRAVHRQRLIGSAIAAVALLVAGIGGWYWDHTRIKTSYYTGVAWRWGEPSGVGEISSSEARHRNVSYKIETVAGRAIRVLRVNGSGGLKPLKGDEIDSDPWNKSVADWSIGYENGAVRTVTVKSDTGELLRVESYSITPATHDGSVQFLRHAGPIALSSVVTDFHSRTSEGLLKRRLAVMQHVLSFDDNGFIVRRLFQTPWQSLTPDENGTVGRDYAYTPDGLVSRVRVLGAKGDDPVPAIGAGGAAEERRSYNAAGDLARFEMRDAHNAVIYAITFTYDDHGNPVDKQWSGPDGKPVFNARDTVAEERDEYDDRGNLTRGRFLDELHRITPSTSSLYAQYVNSYDELGRVRRTAYFNVKGAPALNDKRVASATTILDKAGNLLGIHVFGLDGKPAINSEGYSTMVQRFGAASEPDEVRYYGPDGKLMLNGQGLAILRSKFDKHGNVLDQSWYDVHDKSVNSSGYARSVYQYDERGNKTSEEFWGADGRRAINQDTGTAGSHIIYTAHGDWAQIDFIGTDGKALVQPRTNAARITFQYDERGNPTREQFLGLHGEPVNSAGGFSILEQAYDDKDQIIGQYFYDTNSQLVLTQFGYAATRTRYDAHGNAADVTFLDAKGQPLNSTKGYARVVKVFDANRREIEDRYYGANGEAVTTTDGIAMFRFRYDRRGLKTETATYGLDDKLVAPAALGFAVARVQFDGRGLPVFSAYYDASLKPVVAADGWAIKRVGYDESGLMTDLGYFDANDHPIMRRDAATGLAFARAHLTYLPSGQMATVTYYDGKGGQRTVSFVGHRSK